MAYTTSYELAAAALIHQYLYPPTEEEKHYFSEDAPKEMVRSYSIPITDHHFDTYFRPTSVLGVVTPVEAPEFTSPYEIGYFAFPQGEADQAQEDGNPYAAVVAEVDGRVLLAVVYDIGEVVGVVFEYDPLSKDWSAPVHEAYSPFHQDWWSIEDQKYFQAYVDTFNWNVDTIRYIDAPLIESALQIRNPPMTRVCNKRRPG